MYGLVVGSDDELLRTGLESTYGHGEEDLTRENQSEMLLDFLYALSGHWEGRALCSSGDGRLALVPQQTRESDSIFLPFGSRVPFIVRKAESDWKLIGECYVHGIMQGELFAGSRVEPSIVLI